MFNGSQGPPPYYTFIEGPSFSPSSPTVLFLFFLCMYRASYRVSLHKKRPGRALGNMGLLMLRRIGNTAMVVFWVSVPLLGMALILPWLRIDWLQLALAVPTAVSSAALLVLTYTPGYVSPVSRSLDAERVVYVLVFVYAAGTLAF
jgi:hypothetical protein